MEAAFFKDVGNVNIHNGHFVMKNAPDNSQRTITHHHNTTVNDRSRRTTNYGGYKNYGQHADGNGQINNYGPQTTNNGPVHGYRQYAPNISRYPRMNEWTPSSSDDDNFLDDFQASRGQSYSYQDPDRLTRGDKDYYERYHPASQSESRLGKKKVKIPGFPRAQTEQPNRPTKGKGIDIDSPQFRKEYESMSPQMKAYVRELGFDPHESLDERMANVSLDDPGLQSSRSPEDYGRGPPDVPRKGKNVARGQASLEEDEEDEEDEDEADYDSASRGGQYSSYTHNDNRVITKHINSHNVNTENTVDSFNDNSTRTNINKNKTAR